MVGHGSEDNSKSKAGDEVKNKKRSWPLLACLV